MTLFMKSLTAFCLLSVILLGCKGSIKDTADDQNRLITVIDSFYQAIEDNNVEARIAIFSDSAKMMPNHWTMYQGKESIAKTIRSGSGSVFKLKDRKIIEMEISGHIAYTVNSYFYTWHEQGENPQWHKTKNVHIWKKDKNGAWKLHLDIWNSDVPISQFYNE